MVTITVSGETFEAVRQELQAWGSAGVDVKTPSETKSKKTKPVETHPEEKKSSSDDTPKVITFNEVSAIIPELVAKCGRPKAVEILGRFGAKKGSEVGEKHYAEFYLAAKTEIAIAEKK